jgi:nucleotide-binding universal stress UspA family protein
MHESPHEDAGRERLSIIIALHEQADPAVSFAHALGLAYASRGDLEIIDVRGRNRGVREIGVRDVLEQWGILQTGSDRADVARLGLRVKKISRLGEGRKEIGKRLLRHQHDMMVIGVGERRGLGLFWGQDLADHLAQSYRQTTLFVPRQARPFVNVATGIVKLENILVPVAESPRAEAGLELLRKMLAAFPSETPKVTGFHAGAAFPFVSASWLEGLSWREMVREGPVASTIVKAANDIRADLVVMTTNGRDTLSQRIIGSVTEQVLRAVKCPVLAVAV